ncbi:MAG: alpha-E domain-containing protein [Gammaproteobacteria bacterium]|jgi:uncharacterized alpha-E superfamily protein
MLSRVAENIYWMARYIERAENTARLISVNINLMLDLPKKMHLGWGAIIDITGSNELFEQRYQDTSERNVIKFLVQDTTNYGCILNSLAQARENARTIRDFIPREAWEQINALYQFTKQNASNALAQRQRYQFLTSLTLRTQPITGVLAGTMTHDEGYQFLRLGRNLERADMSTRIIDVRSETLLPDIDDSLAPFESIQWMSVLRSLSAYQMYRRALNQPVRRSLVLDFLLTNVQFPRTYNHCVGEVIACLEHLPRNDEPLRICLHLRRSVEEEDYEKMDQQRLHEFVDQLQIGLINVNQSVYDHYFRVAE